MPPRVGLNCNVSLWGYWLPPRGEIGFLLMEILVYSSLPPCVELLYPYEELHFLTRFRRYDRDFCVFLFSQSTCCNVSSSSGLRNIFVVFWIAPLGRIYLGDADVTVGICC